MRRTKNERYLTVADIARVLEISSPTVRILLTTYEVPVMKLRQAWRIERADAEAFIAEVRGRV
ncbi:helix-turn-helix domain-containing protein [Bifidobacterium crudilactis]|jgi:excisionase family DNA binding protein|uniref:helix-turn-helix domain-containing protein n=1 Tax=Bifidobacterium crudilactis TaxID=327277 RepID=UPI003C6C81D6